MCMTILAGRYATVSGEVLVGHNEDAPGRFMMQTHLVKKRRRHPGTKISFEPGLSELELNETRTNLFWSEASCLDPEACAFCDLYANGHGVVICTNNCADSREDTPELLDGGIGYGLRRHVAEKAHSAREALETACGLVEKYGYASSGRSYSFADKDDIFVMQIVHGKHYAVQRVPDDEVAVIPNHYTIHEPDKGAPGYDELVSYAHSRGWYKPVDGTFDFAHVCQSPETSGLDKNTYRHIRAFEILLDMDLSELKWQKWQGLPFSVKPSRKVDVAMMKEILRSHDGNPHFSEPLTICNTETLESTIIQLRDNPDRIILRKALARPSYSPYLAWYMGIPSIPAGYEDTEPEESLAQHFHLKPEALDWKDNAWFRALEVSTAAEILSATKEDAVRGKIAAFEEEEERELADIDGQIELSLRSKPDIARAIMEGTVMKWAQGVEGLMNSLRDELGILTATASGAVTCGKAFAVRLDGVNTTELEESGCICGPSYEKYSAWSKCAGINHADGTLEFSAGEWMKDAVQCFTDLYMMLPCRDGKKLAGCVRVQVRR